MNFLELIRAPFEDYVLGGDACEYLNFYGFPQRRLAELREHIGELLVITGAEAWERQLAAWKITHAEHRRLLSEAAVWGSVMYHDLYVYQPWLSDDAQQFKLWGFMHALCWVHAERHVAELVPYTRPDALTKDSIRLFSALVNRAAISIANMKLFEQTRYLAVMEERNRLARDLHDSAKQKAFAALAQLGTARGILNGNGNPVSIHLNEAENLVADVIQELTFLVQEIYPLALQEKGLANILGEHIFEWESRNDTKCNSQPATNAACRLRSNRRSIVSHRKRWLMWHVTARQNV